MIYYYLFPLSCLKEFDNKKEIKVFSDLYIQCVLNSADIHIGGIRHIKLLLYFFIVIDAKKKCIILLFYPKKTMLTYKCFSQTSLLV
ncbi:MAG: hypothetical protein COA94_03440 [Rickettsiales bacterium]|nr:MAG: hypothetical protein COA94_03440 [Rickettsiales bacterium]